MRNPSALVLAFDNVAGGEETLLHPRGQCARPFVKWAGGKRSLLPVIRKRIPPRFNTYYEPFVGGGALFFDLANYINKSVLSDINSELMLTYRILKKNPEPLILAVQRHAENHRKKKGYFLKIREMHDLKDPVEKSSRFLYLNKTCYNGLYRVNSKGRFNAPMGSYKNPKICDADNLRAVHKALKKAVVRIRNFEKIEPTFGDFVYCDPPYHETFNGYSRNGFGEEGQRRLFSCVERWVKLGARVMISNSNTPFIRRLYRSFKIEKVSALRSINSNGNGRGVTSELLITTYD